MRGSTLVPVLVSVVAIGVVLAMFQTGASPYITVKEARKLSGDRLSLGCEIDKSTIKQSFKSNIVEFEAMDKDGERIKVRHVGDPVNLKDATRVTCIGKLEGDTFVSKQILVKCPSKYEGEEGKPVKS